MHPSHWSFIGDFRSCEVKVQPYPEVAHGLALGKLLLLTDYNVWIGKLEN